VISAIELGGTGTCVILAGIGLYAAWRRGGTFGPHLVCGISLLLIAIPFYWAFARLVLPWMLMVQIVAAVGIQVALGAAHRLAPFSGGNADRRGRQISMALCLAGFLAVAASASRATTPKADPWNAAAKDGVRNVVTTMTKMVAPESVVFVEEEPDAAFYFQRAGFATFSIMHLANGDGVPEPFSYSTTSPIYLIAGSYALLTPDWNPLRPEFRNRLQPVARFLIHPGDVRLLDDFRMDDVLQYRRHPDERYFLLLFRVVPQQQDPSPQAAR